MRVPLLPVLCVLLVGVLLDCYIYRRMRHAGVRRGWLWVYVAVAIVVSGALLCVDLWPKKSAGDSSLLVLMWALFTYISVYLPKLVFALVSLVQQLLGRLFRRRLRGIAIAGGVFAFAMFALMWWGALFNRFNIQINEVEVPIAGLPPAFDGYRIVQVSDIHSGTYGTDTTFLDKLVNCVNSRQADMIVFTGDIVNRHSEELLPFMSVLGRMQAPDGVLSVMGNHDYGDYYRWPDENAHRADARNLKAMEGAMGWRMLNNENMKVRRGADSLVVIGVENIGDHPFPVYGSLTDAYPDASDSAVKVLLSHNPAHWVDSISGHRDMNIALTLAGHTHAMQIEAFGHSPASLRYPTWGGMYTDSLGRHLYVNIGTGEVGFPARIGATPEVTVFTLRRR
ncbi:MAG: metallophosphoesterase [Muribaculaceae bacterium]|nr:metallophosphoesterase [Muribaculaceae bacterium]